MRKIIVIILALVLVLSMSVPAFAATPKWEYPHIEVPNIKVNIKIPDSVFTNWFKEHPIKLPEITFTNLTLG